MIKIGFIVSVVVAVLKWLGYVSLTWLECFYPLFISIGLALLLLLFTALGIIGVGSILYVLRDKENK